jgi:hypothetical protein
VSNRLAVATLRAEAISSRIWPIGRATRDAPASPALRAGSCRQTISCGRSPGRPSELALFREVAGPQGRLRREEHLIAGARRCVYRITPATDAAPKMGDTAP